LLSSYLSRQWLLPLPSPLPLPYWQPFWPLLGQVLCAWAFSPSAQQRGALTWGKANMVSHDPRLWDTPGVGYKMVQVIEARLGFELGKVNQGHRL